MNIPLHRSLLLTLGFLTVTHATAQKTINIKLYSVANEGTVYVPASETQGLKERLNNKLTELTDPTIPDWASSGPEYVQIGSFTKSIYDTVAIELTVPKPKKDSWGNWGYRLIIKSPGFKDENIHIHDENHRFLRDQSTHSKMVYIKTKKTYTDPNEAKKKYLAINHMYLHSPDADTELSQTNVGYPLWAHTANYYNRNYDYSSPPTLDFSVEQFKPIYLKWALPMRRSAFRMSDDDGSTKRKKVHFLHLLDIERLQGLNSKWEELYGYSLSLSRQNPPTLSFQQYQDQLKVIREFVNPDSLYNEILAEKVPEFLSLLESFESLTLTDWPKNFDAIQRIAARNESFFAMESWPNDDNEVQYWLQYDYEILVSIKEFGTGYLRSALMDKVRTSSNAELTSFIESLNTLDDRTASNLFESSQSEWKKTLYLQIIQACLDRSSSPDFVSISEQAAHTRKLLGVSEPNSSGFVNNKQGLQFCFKNPQHTHYSKCETKTQVEIDILNTLRPTYQSLLASSGPDQRAFPELWEFLTELHFLAFGGDNKKDKVLFKVLSDAGFHNNSNDLEKNQPTQFSDLQLRAFAMASSRLDNWPYYTDTYATLDDMIDDMPALLFNYGIDTSDYDRHSFRTYLEETRRAKTTHPYSGSIQLDSSSTELNARKLWIWKTMLSSAEYPKALDLSQSQEYGQALRIEYDLSTLPHCITYEFEDNTMTIGLDLDRGKLYVLDVLENQVKNIRVMAMNEDQVRLPRSNPVIQIDDNMVSYNLNPLEEYSALLKSTPVPKSSQSKYSFTSDQEVIYERFDSLRTWHSQASELIQAVHDGELPCHSGLTAMMDETNTAESLLSDIQAGYEKFKEALTLIEEEERRKQEEARRKAIAEQNGRYVYSGRDADVVVVVSGKTWVAQMTIKNAYWSASDFPNAGPVVGNRLYDSSGYIEIGSISGKTLRFQIGGSEVSLRKS